VKKVKEKSAEPFVVGFTKQDIKKALEQEMGVQLPEETIQNFQEYVKNRLTTVLKEDAEVYVNEHLQL
jgi:hypothetical protein